MPLKRYKNELTPTVAITSFFILLGFLFCKPLNYIKAAFPPFPVHSSVGNFLAIEAFEYSRIPVTSRITLINSGNSTL